MDHIDADGLWCQQDGETPHKSHQIIALLLIDRRQLVDKTMPFDASGFFAEFFKSKV